MRVLVTGATGFVGYAVAARLCRDGHEVWGLARSGGRLPDGVGRIVGDVRDDAAVRAAFAHRFDAVCHLAALVRVRDSRADPVGYWRTNVGGTLAVLEALAAQEGPPARLVVASTCAVYGEQGAVPITEDAPTQPTHPYGASKLAADRAVADLADTGVIGAVSLRAFNVAGGLPGHADRDETRLVPKAVAVARGRAAELTVNGDGSVVRDYLHVADMADAFALALDSCRPGTLDRLQRRLRPAEHDHGRHRRGGGSGRPPPPGAPPAGRSRARRDARRREPDPHRARVAPGAVGAVADRGRRVRRRRRGVNLRRTPRHEAGRRTATAP